MVLSQSRSLYHRHDRPFVEAEFRFALVTNAAWGPWERKDLFARKCKRATIQSFASHQKVSKSEW